MKKNHYTYNVDAMVCDSDLKKERRELIAFINTTTIKDNEYQEALERIREINREFAYRRLMQQAKAHAIKRINRDFATGVSNSYKALLIGLGFILLYLAYYFTK